MGVDQLFVKAWLMRREEIALTERYRPKDQRLGSPGSAHGEVGEVDRLDPLGLRINHQRPDRERDAVGDPSLLVVQAEQPALAVERVGQGPLPELEQQQRQRAAKQRRVYQVAEEMVETETERHPARSLGTPDA